MTSTWSTHETETRLAIKDGKRTIAYIAIGAERHAPLIESAPELLAVLEQIARLSREADRAKLDVATMLGDIARTAIGNATRLV